MWPIGRLVTAPVQGRSSVSPALLAAAALLSCGAALVGASTAGATSEVTTMPYAGTNMCTGESFTGTATVHTELNENLSTSGTLQYHFNVRIDGMKAVTVLGKTYVVQDTLNHEFVFGGADEESYDMTAHFIRLGEDGSLLLGDDFYEYLRAHITTNDLGAITAFDIRTNDAPCQ